uniref:Uncharacterized protein n=1 Tax=Oryza nivara TaxID=4536 RepID=A0A0E0GTV6_ORYNI
MRRRRRRRTPAVKGGGQPGARRGEAGEAALSMTGSMAAAAAPSLPGGATDDEAERRHSLSAAAARGRRTWRRGDAGTGGGISPASQAPPLPIRSPPTGRRVPPTLPQSPLFFSPACSRLAAALLVIAAFQVLHRRCHLRSLPRAPPRCCRSRCLLLLARLPRARRRTANFSSSHRLAAAAAASSSLSFRCSLRGHPAAVFRRPLRCDQAHNTAHLDVLGHCHHELLLDASPPPLIWHLCYAA